MQLVTEPLAKQREAFLRSADRAAFALFAEMGCGKSRVVIETAAHLAHAGKIDAALVVAPKGVYRNWSDVEIPKHLGPVDPYRMVAVWSASPTKTQAALLERAAKPSDGDGFVWLVMNVEAFSTARATAYAERFLQARRALFAVDESTKIKGHKAARTRAILGLRDLAPYRRILTGAPVTRAPMDLYAPCAFLGPTLLGCRSYYAFRNRYAQLEPRTLMRCARCSHRPWEHEGARRVTSATGEETFAAGRCERCACAGFSHRVVQTEVGWRNLDDLHHRLAAFSYRWTKAESTDLPPKVYLRRTVEMGREQAAAYRLMRDEARAKLSGGEVRAPIVIAQMTRLHQIVTGALEPEGASGSPRLTALLEAIEETEGKVIVWATYTADVERIAKALRAVYGERAVVTYHGRTPADVRPRFVEAFQNDPECRYFVGQPKTGGMGLTLTAAATVVYYSNGFDLEDRIQSEDRAHRIGQTRSVTYVDLVTPGTIDERILDALASKRDVARLIVDGATAREWLA